ncbi:hypothetical protein [Pantoea phage Nafs113]|nr:hypothetical protein [Pantoea phage Nafs113]
MEKLDELAELARLCASMKNSVDTNAAYVNFICRIEPKDITAIAEAFQNLENENAELRQQRAGLAKEANDFESKLSALASQPPVAYTDAEELDTMQKGTYADMFKPCDEYKSDPKWIPLFTRAAPAADLAELIPEKWTLEQALKFVEGYTPPSEEESVMFAVNSFRATILRNIEEQTK